MPDGNVDLGVGKPVKKQTIYIGIAAVGVFGFAYYRYNKGQQASAAAANAAAAAQAPGTGAGTSDGIDPATGFPYGSAEDASALTAQTGYNSPIGGLGYSDQSYLYGGQPFYPGAGYPTSGGFTSNAQWAQAAESYLQNSAGADPTTVGNALGKYITGGQLDDAQTAIVNQAIAFEGYPPVSGPDGFPPSIRTVPLPTGGGTTTPPPTSGTVQVPNVMGQNLATAIRNIQNVGLKEHTLTLAAYGNPSAWKVNGQNPAGGTLPPGGTVVLNAVKA